MAKLGDFATDLNKERDGIWFRYHGSDFECRIARIGNPNFEGAKRRALRDEKVRRAVEGGLTVKESKHALAPLVAEYILVDWRGLEDDDGNPLPYSIEKATEMLRDDRYRDVYDWVLNQANNGDFFLATEAEDAETVGNS
ncbi:MAG: hypothetical protein CMJ75_18660 [Planctomycetaceae bacterium]|nr:hypothetical protein [Planctomycetaceae bacterium]